MNKIRTSYEHTIYASYIGYITQAIVNNFAPLLFLTFASDYNLSLDKITLITTINFAVQLVVDLLATKVIDKVGTEWEPLNRFKVYFAVALGLLLLLSITVWRLPSDRKKQAR